MLAFSQLGFAAIKLGALLGRAEPNLGKRVAYVTLWEVLNGAAVEPGEGHMENVGFSSFPLTLAGP